MNPLGIRLYGTFVGFNTVLLAEPGSRLNKNTKPVQVDSVGRAAALYSGTVDVVFWTHGMACQVVGMSRDEFEQFRENSSPQISYRVYWELFSV